MHAGGLGGYGSGDSEDERSDRGSESSDTDDEELRHRIRQKQEAFWRKEREQQLLLEKQLEGKSYHVFLLCHCIWSLLLSVCKLMAKKHILSRRNYETKFIKNVFLIQVF